MHTRGPRCGQTATRTHLEALGVALERLEIRIHVIGLQVAADVSGLVLVAHGPGGG